MNHSIFNKLFKHYIQTGLLYGGARSIYWLSNLDDTTYTRNTITSKLEEVQHKPTISSIIYHSLFSITSSQVFWPIFALNDLSYYEKSKLGINELTPPFPFDDLKWRK